MSKVLKKRMFLKYTFQAWCKCIVTVLDIYSHVEEDQALLQHSLYLFIHFMCSCIYIVMLLCSTSPSSKIFLEYSITWFLLSLGVAVTGGLWHLCDICFIKSVKCGIVTVHTPLDKIFMASEFRSVTKSCEASFEGHAHLFAPWVQAWSVAWQWIYIKNLKDKGSTKHLVYCF